MNAFEVEAAAHEALDAAEDSAFEVEAAAHEALDAAKESAVEVEAKDQQQTCVEPPPPLHAVEVQDVAMCCSVGAYPPTGISVKVCIGAIGAIGALFHVLRFEAPVLSAALM